MFDKPEVESLDLTGCADALVASVAAQRRAGAERLALAAHFADLHGPGSTHRAGCSATRVRMVPGGSDGTPEVSEFAADELGVLTAQSTRSASALLRDALDLRHRHPRLWEQVMTGAVEDWKARKVAQACAVLSQERALWVDEVTVEAVVGLAFGRALSVVEGKVVAADPAGREARRRAAEAERFVRATRSDEAGLRMLYARTTAADVARLDAMIGHLAGLLGAAGDTDDVQRRRAKALGLLANPALACLVLADVQQAGLSNRGAAGAAPTAALTAALTAAPTAAPTALPLADAEDDLGDAPEDHLEPEGPTEHEQPADAVAAARVLGTALLERGSSVVDRLRPRTVLYLHLAEEAVATGDPSGEETAVVRSEGLGALTRAQLTEWLGTDRVVVKPVIDLHGQEPVDGYEVPLHLREALVLAHPVEVFPWGTTSSRSRTVDADHTEPWVPRDDGGPPGQTRLGNLGPLARGHHRAKTLGGFVCHQPLPGLYLWRTPTGHWYRVDHTGTTALGRAVPHLVRQLTDAPRAGREGPRADWSAGEHHLLSVASRRAA